MPRRALLSPALFMNGEQGILNYVLNPEGGTKKAWEWNVRKSCAGLDNPWTA